METIESTVLKLELELLDPAVRADTLRLDALLAEDFLEVGATGRSFGKSDVLARLPQESGVSFSVGHMQAHLLASEVVLVTYSAERTCQDQSHASLRSSLWVKNTNGWQMRYHQGTCKEPST
jgi:hypothetical protein